MTSQIFKNFIYDFILFFLYIMLLLISSYLLFYLTSIDLNFHLLIY